MTNSTIILVCIGGYLVLLILLGLYANKTGSSKSLKDFYLAGNGLGSFVLLLTLYATQYSANTMLIVPAEVRHQGVGMILILGYMTAVVVIYLTFAPQLFAVSRQRPLITPGDWLSYRYQFPALTLLINLIYGLVLVNFLLAQLIAAGEIAHSITDGQVPYWAGVIFLALIMIVYETLGGMRAVAWTDVLQGCLLLTGLLGIFLMVFPGTDQLGEITSWLIAHEPEKVQVPDLDFRRYWASTVLMVGLGAAMYPQSIQRIYAAKNLRSLKRSLSFMVFMPLFTILILFLLGIISIPVLAEVEGLPRDSVLPEMLRRWGEQSTFTFAMTILVIVGLLAAIMSTADSVLLSLSSILTKDILGASVLKNATDAQLTRIGKWLSWGIMLGIVLWSLHPTITLWGLIELKMQLLVQVAPAFILGVHFPKVKPIAIMCGLVVGLVFSLTTFFLAYSTLYGIQSGLVGLMLNLLTCFIGQNTLTKRIRKVQ
ncbi:MAG: sodium:solute symporter [Cyclobacteriaceae bacterium]